MMISPTGPKTGANQPAANAFTLIELILVMALMVVVIALLAPSLGNFFRARTLDSEARRFLALARYGRSRAISEGVPMLLWVDAERGAYGLTQEYSYSARDEKAVGYQLEPEVAWELDRRGSTSAQRSPVPPVGLGLGLGLGANTVVIRFDPDGYLGDGSPTGLWLRQRARDGSGGRVPPAIWITQDPNRVSYEIQTNELAYLRR